MAVARLNVTFGWHLDSRQGPLLESRLGAPGVGRFGMLGLLELYLGLAGPSVTRSHRVAAFLGCLRKADDGQRFYSASLRADEMGVASELLNWRDEWLLYGWDGTAPADAPKRVADMAAVQALCPKLLPLGEADRLQLVEGALSRHHAPLAEVCLVDDLGRFPARWRAVLALLPCRIDSGLTPSGRNEQATLVRLQRAAMASQSSGQIEPLSDVVDDGSVAVYRADSTDVALHWLMLNRKEPAVDQVLVCEHEGTALDDIFRANSEPVCGFDRGSEFRPALQALPLALELLWSPADVHRVLEFLVHPYGPFKRQARRVLARAYAKQPGYGGDGWQAAKAEVRAMEGGHDLIAEVQFWFEGPHWSREDGAPLAEVEARVDRVVSALRAFMAKPRDDLAAVGGGIRQGQAYLDALSELKAQGLERLTPRHVEQLLAQSTTAGSSNPYSEPEAGCRRSATVAAVSALEPAKEIVWWMPSKPALPHPHKWSSSEIEALKARGAELRDMAVELTAVAKDWLRPLLAAQDRFILVLPPAPEEEHPIWLLLRRLMPNLLVRHIESELAESEHTEVVVDGRLPALSRYMHVPSDMTSVRESQSFTSLADLFDNPAVSVLKDAASLRGITLMTVEDERRLLGTLAHRLVENLFKIPGVLTWGADEVRGWLDAHVDALIEAEGAPLLMLGFSIALHRFKGAVREATVALVIHLQAAGAVSVRPEVPYEGTLFGTPVVGKVDLLVELPGPRLTVIDLKWSGQSRYRDRLLTGTHLQLAIYAALVEQNEARAPVDLAFFVFDARALLATSNAVFPNAVVCAPPVESTVPHLLTRAEATLRWRREQLAGGVLELVDLRLGDMEDFQGPEGTLPVKELGPWNDAYVALLGWEVGA
jgi:PD-(D/E)XK nuclease superfamily